MVLVARNSYYQLGPIDQLCPFLELTLVNCVISMLCCYNVLYVGLPLKTLQKLQMIFRTLQPICLWVEIYSDILELLKRHCIDFSSMPNSRGRFLPMNGALFGLGVEYLKDPLFPHISA